MANLRIDIASEFTGKRAFSQAEGAVGSLEKSVGKLAKKLAGAFSVYKIAQFSRQSVNAFMEDQKAAASLANELKNVGLSYNTQAVEDFIKSMQNQTGILDDELRPAFGRLIRVTGSLNETQKIMATAFDVSAANGQDYQSVIDALSQAYVGNIKGLKSLSLGLTQAELKGKTFSQILDVINSKFAGAGAAALDTYAGKVKLLKVAFADAQETIGKGFVDAFSTLAADKDFNSVLDHINDTATAVADIVRGIGIALDAINSKMPKWLIDFLNPTNKGILGLLKELGKKQRLADPQLSANTSYFSRLAAQKQQAKADIEAAKRAKALADAIKKQTAAQNELIKKKKEAAALDALSLKYKQAEAIFDMEKIQLAAASMGKQTAEDYARIKLKQDLISLQDAINAGDLKTAEALSKVVAEDYKRVWAYQAQNIALGIQNGTIQNIQNAVKLIPTDLNVINLDNLNQALAAINAIIAALSAIKIPTVGGTVAPTSPKGTIPNVGTKDYGGNIIGSEVSKSIADMYNSLFAANGSPITGGTISSKVLSNLSAIGGVPTMSPNAYGPQPITITVVDNTSGLIDVITDATQQGSANGISTRILRNTGNLNW